MSIEEVTSASRSADVPSMRTRGGRMLRICARTIIRGDSVHRMTRSGCWPCWARWSHRPPFGARIRDASWWGGRTPMAARGFSQALCRRTGIKVLLDDLHGAFADTLPGRSGRVYWESSYQFPDLIRGCARRLFERLDTARWHQSGRSIPGRLYPDISANARRHVFFLPSSPTP